MSYEARIRKSVTIPAEQTDAFIADLLKSKIKGLPTNKFELIKELSNFVTCGFSSDGSIVFNSETRYLDDPFEEILKMVARYVGRVECEGEDGSCWCYTYSKKNKQVIEQQGVICYPPVDKFTIFDNEDCIVMKDVSEDDVREFVTRRNNVTLKNFEEFDKWLDAEDDEPFEVQGYRVYKK